MDNENKTTARFLQARITTLSTILVTRLENIFAAALSTPDLPAFSGAAAADTGVMPPTYVETAAEHLSLDVESTALIRAAEEIMVLTRGLKDLWLFGGLHTLKTPDQGEKKGDGEDFQMENGVEEERKKVGQEDDIRIVGEALKKYLVEAEKVDERDEMAEDGKDEMQN